MDLRPRRTAGVGCVLALTASLVSGCSSSGHSAPRAEVGSQRHAVAAELTGRVRTLQTLQGRLDVLVTSPTSVITDPHTAARVHAPSGGSFVGLDLRPGAKWISDVPVRTADSFPAFTLSVVTGGRAYPVDLAHLVNEESVSSEQGDLPYGAIELAVAGTPTDVSLKLEQDSVTQTVDVATGRRDAGRLAPLYTADRRATGTRSCGPVTVPAVFTTDSQNACTIAYRRVPWIAGLGFPAAGQAWLLAHVDTGEVGTLTVRGTGNDVLLSDEPTLSVTFAGHAAVPVGFGTPPMDPVSGEVTVAFAVPADADANADLMIASRYTVRVRFDPGPAGTAEGSPVTVSWHTRIR